MLSKASILMMNDIIYKIHTQKDYKEMRQEFLETIRYIVPYHFATFYLASSDGDSLLCDPVGVNIHEDQLNEYIENMDEDYSRGVFLSGRGRIYKESEIFPAKEFDETAYYHYIFRKNNVRDALTVSIAKHEVFLGVITFYRNYAMPEFTAEEIFMMELLQIHLEERMAKEYAQCVHKGSVKAHINMEQVKEKYALTERECCVLEKLLEGNSIDEICQICNISVNTMRKHTMNIYRKLEIHSRPELAKLFYE
ncbi:MAG: LuxR C-terminal-related transcriptional regulator [Lentihominibacter sp.]|nr:LuxR C-terminal-related transcriptional regulator [Lentihominibacter sp.]